MIIGIGSDHGGFELKEEMKKFLEESGHQVKDFGTHSKESVDYPDYGRVVGEAVVSGGQTRPHVVAVTAHSGAG